MKFIKQICLSFLYCISLNLYSVGYKAKPLDVLPMLTDAANTISFNHKVFTPVDCLKYLGRNKFKKNGFQPIQISLTNNTEQPFMFSLSAFNLPCLDVDEVSTNMHFNTLGRVIGWSIGGLFLWPLFIPAIIEAVESPRANEIMDYDYARKSLRNQIVKPYTTINGLIFVPYNSFKENLSFAITDSKYDRRYVLSTQNPSQHISKSMQVEDELVN